jgi:hypothetical protein
VLVVVATPRLLHVVQGDSGAVSSAYRSARSDIVHVEFTNVDDVIVVVLQDARIVRVQLKRTRDGDALVSSLDDFPVVASLNVSLKSIARMSDDVWLARLSDGSSRAVLNDSFQWLVVGNDIDLTRPVYAHERMVRQAEVDMLGEAIVHVRVTVIRGRQVLCVIGAFGTVAFVVGERVWRLSVGLSRCLPPCAITDDAELLLVNNGERLVVVSLRDSLPVDAFDATPYARICNAPTCRVAIVNACGARVAWQCAIERRVCRGGVLACGTVLTLGREFLQPETFPIATAPRRESLQQLLSELESAAHTGAAAECARRRADSVAHRSRWRAAHCIVSDRPLGAALQAAAEHGPVLCV